MTAQYLKITLVLGVLAFAFWETSPFLSSQDRAALTGEPSHTASQLPSPILSHINKTQRRTSPFYKKILLDRGAVTKNVRTILNELRTKPNLSERLRFLRSIKRNRFSDNELKLLSQERSLTNLEQIAVLGSIFKQTKDFSFKNGAKHRLLSLVFTSKSRPTQIFALKELRNLVARDKTYMDVITTLQKNPEKYGKELAAVAAQLEKSIAKEFAKS